MRELTRAGMHSRTLMEWVLRIMANLLRPDEIGPAEAAYKRRGRLWPVSPPNPDAPAVPAARLPPSAHLPLPCPAERPAPAPAGPPNPLARLPLSANPPLSPSRHNVSAPAMGDYRRARGALRPVKIGAFPIATHPRTRSRIWTIPRSDAGSPRSWLPRTASSLVAMHTALGLSRRGIARRIGSGHLDEPSPGVLRLCGTPGSWQQAVRIATLAAGGHAVASHRAAAALHELDGCPPSVVEVSVQRPRHMSLAGVIVHEVGPLDQRDITTVDGIACTSVARTLADLGSVVEASAVERALDDARRRGTSLRWLR